MLYNAPTNVCKIFCKAFNRVSNKFILSFFKLTVYFLSFFLLIYNQYNTSIKKIFKIHFPTNS